MTDYLLNFTDEPTAQTDHVVGKYWQGPPSQSKGKSGAHRPTGSWQTQYVIPGVQVWADGGDTTATVTRMSGRQVTVKQHTYLPGFWLLIRLPTDDNKLDSHPALVTNLAGMNISPVFA